MIGAIIGDVCGSVYEFDNEKDINKVELFKEGCFPTDDSIMTIAVARALIDSRNMKESAIKERIIDSMHYFGNLFPRAGYGGTFAQWIKYYEREPYDSWGNGSAMRVSPCGWLYDSISDVMHMAKLTAEITHNHPEGIRGAQAIAVCILLARKGKSKDEIKAYVEDKFYPIMFTLEDKSFTSKFDVSCQGSCPVAIEAFLEGNSFEDVIMKAIAVGGDSDTIACMAGSIAEAYYGVPDEIVAKLFSVLVDKEDKVSVYNNSVIADEIKRFYARLDPKERKVNVI